MIVAGNWKMNKTPSEAIAFVKELIPRLAGAKSEVVVGVPFVALQGVVEALKGSNIKVAAQNMHYEEKGAYTGEVSAGMLKDIGVDYVIIGHSERRQYFGETDASVNKKVLAAIGANLIPIVCVGESLGEREQGVTPEIVRRQIKIALLGVDRELLLGSRLVVAYEPIWAIGTGKTATNEQADEVCRVIRGLLAELYDAEAAAGVFIQYGGSVTAANAKELFAMPDIDGGLVGGASLKADDFVVIANA
jgi:triosephosphate isomerase